MMCVCVCVCVCVRACVRACVRGSGGGGEGWWLQVEILGLFAFSVADGGVVYQRGLLQEDDVELLWDLGPRDACYIYASILLRTLPLSPQEASAQPNGLPHPGRMWRKVELVAGTILEPLLPEAQGLAHLTDLTRPPSILVVAQHAALFLPPPSALSLPGATRKMIVKCLALRPATLSPMHPNKFALTPFRLQVSRPPGPEWTISLSF
jgi:hypothetical protein